jgi:hypothetical protein
MWSRDELKERIDVDWTANPHELSNAKPSEGEPPFKVIWLRNGGRYHWESGEPNQVILDYLKTGKSPLDNSPAPAGAPHS